MTSHVPVYLHFQPVCSKSSPVPQIKTKRKPQNAQSEIISYTKGLKGRIPSSWSLQGPAGTHKHRFSHSDPISSKTDLSYTKDLPVYINQCLWMYYFLLSAQMKNPEAGRWSTIHFILMPKVNKPRRAKVTIFSKMVLTGSRPCSKCRLSVSSLNTITALRHKSIKAVVRLFLKVVGPQLPTSSKDSIANALGEAGIASQSDYGTESSVFMAAQVQSVSRSVRRKRKRSPR